MMMMNKGKSIYGKVCVSDHNKLKGKLQSLHTISAIFRDKVEEVLGGRTDGKQRIKSN